MSHANLLPLELVYAILEADYLTPNGEPDRRFLTVCSLVCRSWRTSAQQLLYTDVVLSSERAFQSFHYAAQNSALTNAVRTLRVILDHNQPNGFHQRHLAIVLLHCPRLHSLSLSLFGHDCVQKKVNSNHINFDGVGNMLLRRFRSEDVTLAEALRQSPIESLHLSNWSPNSAILPTLLGSLPRIKVLSITGTPPAVPNPNLSSSANLSHFRINFQRPPSVDAVRWLLDNSRSSLKAVDIERLPDSDVSFELLDHLTTQHGSNLHSITMPSCATPTELKHFQRCTHLRRVAFRSPNVSPTLFKSLLSSTRQPPVEEMWLCLDKNTALSPVIEVVRKMQTLQKLVICPWDTDVRRKLRLWGSLKMACATSGVELEIVDDSAKYKSLLNCGRELH